VFNSGFGVSNAPRQPKPSPGGGMMGMGMNQPPPPPKADDGKATSLLNVLQIAWDNGQIVWDQYNPHPEFGDVPREFLFVSPRSGVETAFSPNSDITKGLQEILAAFSGTLRPRRNSNVQFEPLLRTGVHSGLLDWEEFTEQSFDFQRMAPVAQLSPTRAYFEDSDSHVLAAHITSEADPKLNVVYVADIDLISDWFFMQRERQDIGLQLDNVAFVLNAVDVLAGDDSFLELRRRRAQHRTLKAVESLTSQFREERQAREETADAEAKKQLEAARERFKTQREEIEKDPNLDERTKEVMLRNIQATEERRLQVDEANIERAKQKEIDTIKARTERQVRQTETWIRYLAVLVPPIPAILLGLVILSRRLANERRDIADERRAQRR
jgi:ABC-2 type transport system permease protein